MTTSEGTAMKEFFRLMKNVDKLTMGQASLHMAEDEDTQNEGEFIFMMDIKPNDGYYKGGTFQFEVALCNYPENAPTVICLNNVYHPNIDYETRDENCDKMVRNSVCVNLLDSDWSQEVGLDGCVMAILFLFYNPQLDDCLNPAFNGDGFDDLERFAGEVQISMRGGEIDEYLFDKVIDINDVEEKEKEEDVIGQRHNNNKTDGINVAGVGEVTTDANTIDSDKQALISVENRNMPTTITTTPATTTPATETTTPKSINEETTPEAAHDNNTDHASIMSDENNTKTLIFELLVPDATRLAFAPTQNEKNDALTLKAENAAIETIHPMAVNSTNCVQPDSEIPMLTRGCETHGTNSITSQIKMKFRNLFFRVVHGFIDSIALQQIHRERGSYDRQEIFKYD